MVVTLRARWAVSAFPVATWKLIPMYAQQRGFLTVYSSLFCFLLVAFVFSIRHRLARAMFFDGAMAGLVSVLPALFMLLTLACIVVYHGLIQQSIGELRSVGLGTVGMEKLLNEVDATQIPYGVELAASYLGIFIFAELAFVLMAIREYLQDLLHLDEEALLRGKIRAAAGAKAGRTRSQEPVDAPR